MYSLHFIWIMQGYTLSETAPFNMADRLESGVRTIKARRIDAPGFYGSGEENAP